MAFQAGGYEILQVSPCGKVALFKSPATL